MGRQQQASSTSVHKNAKGLDLPLAGEPAPQVAAAPVVTKVALLGADSVGLKPSLLVEPGARVLLGQPIFEDKKNPGVRYTAPVTGRISELHRGERRALVSVVVDAEPQSKDRVRFSSWSGRPAATLADAEVRALLIESGLWTALRGRPFGRVPAAADRPAAIFITAMDTRPHAPPPEATLEGRTEDFVEGQVALTKLTDGPVYLCRASGSTIAAAPGVQAAEFAGPHPSGNAGWHIHRLMPVSMHRRVWHVGCQDVAAIGHLLRTGELDLSRVVSLAGPGALWPRLLRTQVGASIEQLTHGELKAGRQRVISGSVLDGRAVTGPGDGFLGRYHQQIAVLPEGGEREMFGYIAPGAEKFSVTGSVLGAFRRAHRFAFTTTTNGSPRAMVPIGSYERVMPFDILPTFLLRALIIKDDLRATELGALELDEDDIALCTYVCPGKTEYGPLLRGALERIEKEH
jgi:Na+-transporting NADH:ubiquinone oxidoreductase subunit A